MIYLIVNGQLPNFKREKNKKIRDLKKELRRVQQLEYNCYDLKMIKKYKKRINEIEDLIQKEVDQEIGINKKNNPWE